MKDVYNSCDRYSSSLLYGKNSRSNILKFAIEKEKENSWAYVCIYICASMQNIYTHMHLYIYTYAMYL